MAEFEVSIEKIREVQNHPNADRLVVYKFVGNDLTIVAGKDNAQETGTDMLFLPEHSIVPEYLLKEFGFWDEEKGKGMLSGKLGNVVKPIKLRGVYSDGLALPIDKVDALDVVKDHVEENQNTSVEAIMSDLENYTYAGILGIVKYEAPIKAFNPITQEPLFENKEGKVKFDVENYHKYAGYIIDGEPVVVTIKYHGSCAIYRVARDPNTGELTFDYSTKNKAQHGQWFKKEESNWYKTANEAYSIEYNMKKQFDFDPTLEELVVVGEVFGSNVQKGWSYDIDGIGFKAFDIKKNGMESSDYVEGLRYLYSMGLPVVERLHPEETIPFDKEVVSGYANAPSNTSPGFHEGVVVRPYITRDNPSTSQPLLLKYISEKYKEKKNKTPIEEDIN